MTVSLDRVTLGARNALEKAFEKVVDDGDIYDDAGE